MSDPYRTRGTELDDPLALPRPKVPWVVRVRDAVDRGACLLRDALDAAFEGSGIAGVAGVVIFVMFLIDALILWTCR